MRRQENRQTLEVPYGQVFTWTIQIGRNSAANSAENCKIGLTGRWPSGTVVEASTVVKASFVLLMTNMQAIVRAGRAGVMFWPVFVRVCIGVVFWRMCA